ncbi:g4551 [Coccomyxa elongata]
MHSLACRTLQVQQREALRFSAVREQRCRAPCKPVNVMAPSRPQQMTVAHPLEQSSKAAVPTLISRETVQQLEAELDNGESIRALRRFNDLLQNLPAQSWEGKLRRVMGELAYNLESFNPAFTAVLLKVQATIGHSDYVARDMALKNLIQPLAGEYGMHNGLAQGKTHRELFSDFYADLLRQPLEDALAANPRPAASVHLFQRMMADIMSSSGDSIEQASYAMGYNLAIEYLADYEKTWMLDSFRALNERVLVPQQRGLSQWLFLEVHAEGEAEHAAIGHAAVVGFVPAEMEGVLRRAMLDHDRDFAAFYNTLADMLE